MGLKDVANDVLRGIEDGVDAGKRIVGKGVDLGTDLGGDMFRMVGADGVADKVEDVGDSIASSLGAEVGEQQLGQTEQANELIHGSPTAIRESAKHLKDFFGAFDRVGQGMKALDSSNWKGEAANAFREEFAMHPAKWLHAADACEAAGKALDAYADTVKWAQDQAKEAIDLYRQGREASKTAAAAYNDKADAYKTAAEAGKDPGPPLADFNDPGTSMRERAQELLTEVRRQRNTASETVQRVLDAALAHAPAERPPLDRWTDNFADFNAANGVELLHLGGGAIKGVAGLANFARSLNPMDIHNIKNPAQFMETASMTLSGLVSTTAQPERALTQAWETFKKDPMEFVGRMLPEAVGTKGAGTLRAGLRAGLKDGIAPTPGHTLLDPMTSRGSGADLPPFEEVKRAVLESNPEVLSRRWPDDDGRYYASRVLRGGRADGEPVLAGHGYLQREAGEVVVPPGTSISFYVQHGERIPGLNGVAVEGGSYPGLAVETYYSGDRIPNYTLGPPEPQGPGGFTVYENSTTVARRTRLDDLLHPGMGNVHWAACRELEN
ncbi:hypothetical protein NLX86_22520 [Streptomyces sp. A3M-1-3]|uniref:putative T7SS-secreted protein n=1 Tax=Streptomyces sp. A3M-1-3 TaxID=2962044 RepID=UPI0020B8BBC8|nr:hypothetical protein [Streptomyces sp. A3M-1-3]MCP3820767.1 hypothetical protein [Streptomyces sp. A3M-1-3]